jgi:hypothetical protein
MVSPEDQTISINENYRAFPLLLALGHKGLPVHALNPCLEYIGPRSSRGTGAGASLAGYN